jgi:outer membrane immunogenic protein
MKAALSVAVVAGLLASAAPAFAQSPDDWSGFYVGGHLGVLADPDDDGDSILFDTDQDGSFNDTVRTGAGADAFSPGFCDGAAKTPTPGGGCSDNSGGADYGVRAGYDWQIDQWVFGVVGEYAMNDARDAVSAFSTTPARYTMVRKMDGMASLRARIGYALGDNSENLLYVTAGGAWAQIENSFNTSNGANSFTSSGDEDASGYQIGAGYERKFYDGKFSVGIEYLFTSLEDEDARVRVGPGTAPPTNPFLLVNPSGTDFRRSDKDFDLDSLRLTATYRF